MSTITVAMPYETDTAVVLSSWPGCSLRMSGDSLNEPVPVDLLSYSAESREIHRRIMSEFPRALDRLEERLREYGCEPRSKVILPFQTKHG